MDDQLPSHTPHVFHLPFPVDYEDELDSEVLSRANAMCGAAEAIFAAMVQSGQTPTITPDDRLLATNALDSRAAVATIQKTAIALHITALLSELDMPVVQNAQQLRNLCTNKLVQLATEGEKETTQLRAIELLGKIKDVGLFEERSTVLVEHMTTSDLQTRLREKVASLRGYVSGR
jgi:hypothetical protein